MNEKCLTHTGHISGSNCRLKNWKRTIVKLVLSFRTPRSRMPSSRKWAGRKWASRKFLWGKKHKKKSSQHMPCSLGSKVPLPYKLIYGVCEVPKITRDLSTQGVAVLDSWLHVRSEGEHFAVLRRLPATRYVLRVSAWLRRKIWSVIRICALLVFWGLIRTPDTPC